MSAFPTSLLSLSRESPCCAATTWPSKISAWRSPAGSTYASWGRTAAANRRSSRRLRASAIRWRERGNIFELRSMLGIVSPDLLASCTTDATGRDVVLSGFFNSTRIFPHHQPDPGHLTRAEAALERLEIGHLADRPVSQMSSGEAKRTLIARALVHNPQTLLFDEPSNALDIAAQLQ